MSYADWSQDDYDYFQTAAFDYIFDEMPLAGLSQDQFDEAQYLFQQGWINLESSEAERLAARDAFFELTNYPDDRFPWRMFGELYDEADIS